ncbi:PAS domain-containing protein [Nostoc sp. FACHB-152]|uniref:PAS domain-containing protein n=1 Tax=unclassified Nostoc TaxID=2593658 RepID=UPI0016883C32|nr:MULTISPECIES: PAS domain-containing protein [unclassified Nostoc]MBD2446168.1 PAS domain-containing protein [Nostoc sp. FACHB-152]MBD2467400.1 PAS domain-containing protein [Nostoc sp. FACHB-145]
MDIAELCLLDENYQQLLLKVSHNTSVFDVIQLMNQAQTSYALVFQQEKLVGIFTERDVVRSLANNISFADMAIAQLMSQPVITVSQEEAENFSSIRQLFHQHCIRHLPVIDNQGQVLDVITPNALGIINAIELSTVVENLQQTIDAKTAEIEREVSLCQEMTKLLLERETTLNDILNSAIATSIVSFRLFPNRHAEYIYQSVGSETLFGYTPKEIMSDTNLWMSRVHPQDMETVIKPLFTDIFAGRTIKVEYRFAHKDNSWRWIGATYASRYDAQANCWIVTGTSVDITEQQAALRDRIQAEETLQRNEERWQLAIAGTDEAIWDWDISTNQTFRSDRWYEMLGYQRHELSNSDDEWSIRIHPEDLESVIAQQEAYLSRQAPDYHAEYRLRRQDGSYGWFRSRAKAIWDEEGNPVRLIGSLGDITERKRIETALAQSEAQYRLLFENNPNPMWIFDPDTLVFLAVNHAATHKYGYSQSEFLSMTLADISPPEEVPELLRTVLDPIILSPCVYLCEAKHQTRDGKVIDVEINSHPISWLGKTARFVLAKDITDRKQVEQALQEREALLRRIGDNLPNGAIYKVIRELDGSDRFYYLSAGIENLMEVKAEDALKDSSLLYRQFIAEDVPRLQAAVDQSMRDLSVFDIQLRICTPSGQPKWFHFRSSPRHLEDGRVAWDGLVVDVTDIKRTEETLRQSEARLEESQRVARLGNWDYDLATGKITWSKGLFDLFGRDLSLLEPSYEENLDLYHPEDRQKLAQAVAHTISTGEPYKLVLRATRTDGRMIYVEGVGQAEFNADGQAIRLFGTAQDISEQQTALRDRIQTEQALQESERRFRAIFNNTFQFTGLLSVEGILLEANETALIFAGLTPEDVMNKPFWETHWWTISSQTQAELKQAISQAAQGNFVRYEVDVLGANNRVATIDFSLRPLHDENGQVVLLIPEGRDISQQRAALRDRFQAEEQLRRSEALLATAQKIAHVGSWEWNLGDERHIWSTETFRIFGLSPVQLAPTQTEFLLMVHPEDRPTLQSQFLWAVIEGTHFNVEYRIIRPDGSLRYVESKAEVAYNTQGRIIKLFGAILDITERKQIELEITHSRDFRETIFNESTDALFLVDAETLLTTDCNQRAVELFEAFGKAELIGIDGSSLQKQKFTPQERTAIIEEINQQGFWSREIEYVTKRCNFFWGNIAAKPIIVGERVMQLVRVTDITARKRAEAEQQRIEAALAKSEEQLRLTLEFNHIGLWDWDIATDELIWNDNHFLLLGLNPEISKANYPLWRNGVHPEDIGQVEQAISQALKNHTNYEAEYRVIYPNGEIHWLAAKGQAIYNPADQPIRMLGIVIDISEQQAALQERKRAEQALQEKEHFLRSIYDSVGQSIFVVDVVDNDFYCVSVNYTHQELIGLHIDELQDTTPEQVFPPAVAKVVRQHYQDCVTAGKTITYEECLPFKGQETWWITSLTPLKDENSHIYRIVGSSLNITAQKRAQKMLELQAVITRNMAEGICLVRVVDGIFVYTNPKFEQMFGYEPGELIGRHVSIVNYRDENTTPDEVTQRITHTILQHSEATYEIHNVKKDGTGFWCQATASVFEHPEYGTVLVAVQQDITEHKLAEEQIKTSLKEKEVLLKEIHHRVKNNLGIVSSLLQMQCRRTQDPQATAILRDSQNRIASIALVHEKLYRSADLANIDFAQYIPDLTTHLFDSYNVSSNFIKLNIQVDNTSLDIETAIPCGLIINELVSNALKYAFPDNRTGEIQVSLSQQNKCDVILIIRDNGIGLPADFDTKKIKTLGITLVQGLVKQLRGTLEINSHQGTEFKIKVTKSRA